MSLRAWTKVLPLASAAPLALLLLIGSARPPQDSGAPQRVPEHLSREEVYTDLDRAVQYLVDTQAETGRWGTRACESLLDLGFATETYHAYQFGAHAVACMALAAVSETSERRIALENAVHWLCGSPIPTRGDDWDIDNVWSALYGFVALVDLVQDERFARDPWKAGLERRGQQLYRLLARYQALSGGWAYYDDPPFLRTPTWATSFCTALVLPSLLEAQALGWDIDERVIARALKYVRRCAMPGGAYAYDLTPIPRISGVEHINLIQGSLGRTQVCNWALARAGVQSITPDVIRAGLDAFFDYHGFLDHVRTRPIPHEGFYANAGYFYFFGHYYAAQVIGLLPEDEREAWHARLRPHLTKTMWANGGASDFLDAPYAITASTSYIILALSLGLEEPDQEPDQEPEPDGEPDGETSVLTDDDD